MVGLGAAFSSTRSSGLGPKHFVLPTLTASIQEACLDDTLIIWDGIGTDWGVIRRYLLFILRRLEDD
jgi:hypothetical protein